MYRVLTYKELSNAKNLKLIQFKLSGGFREVCNLNSQPLIIFQNCINLKKKNNAVAASLLYLMRPQSTTSTETLNKKKRVRRCHYSKYVDLLEVTAITANERKSRVKRLTAKKFEDIMAKSRKKNQLAIPTTVQIKNFPDFYSLDSSQLESEVFDDKPMIFLGKKNCATTIFKTSVDFDNVLKSFYNYRELVELSKEEKLEPVSEDNFNFHDSESLHQVEMMPCTPKDKFSEGNTKTKLTKNTKERFKSGRHGSEELERLAKDRALLVNLTTYLNVCVASGALSRGLSTIFAYRHRLKNNKFKSFININLYNTLLHGFAEKADFDRFLQIFTLIKEDKLNFNEQTFAAIFECLGRSAPSDENFRLIQTYINELEKMDYTLNQVMDNSKFLYDQREYTLGAIRRVRHYFKPNYTPPLLGYDNVLLNKLNENIKPVEEYIGDNLKNIESTTENLIFTKQQLQEMVREQLKIELNGCITVTSIEKTIEYNNAEFCRKKLKELELLWRSQISSAILRDINTLKAQVRFKLNGSMNYYLYLRALDTTLFTDILINEIYKLAEGSETFSPTVGQLCRDIGQKVQHRYHIEQQKKNGLLKKLNEIYDSYCTKCQSQGINVNHRQTWQLLVHAGRNSGPSMDHRTVNWPGNILTGIGRFLFNILLRDVKIDSKITRKSGKHKQQHLLPAFYTLFRNHGRLVKEEVKPHPVLARLLRTSRQQMLSFDANLIPMLCPPQPWSTPHNGAYLLSKCDLIRLPHQAIQQWERINCSSPQMLYPALDSLNQLASVPWRVNTTILDIIIKVFQNGGDHKLHVPQSPYSLPPLPSIHINIAALSNDERAKLFKEKWSHRRRQAEMYSLWCDTLYRLSLANHFRDKIFWLPHNMDFRGRVYPIPPHLNHLGSDLARSMLVFNTAKPLGPNGLRWLKLHCINLTGLKKRDSLRERLLYADDVMSEILDSADHPLTGRMWWTKSDEPWQTLACCIEIAKVIRSDNTEEFMSHFPIHQDGSCNGLQHYAALGRDKVGACSVNLSPSDVPQDVYSNVAVLVEKTRKKDADNGLTVAKALEGYVRRKVIKQTVMTTVYGVTRYGARLQIARQLKDIEDFPKDYVWPASSYLTTKTFESLREMFTSTREIQDWFTDCARLISGVCGQNVEWITPLGLPVVQPYNRQELKISNSRSEYRVTENTSTDMYERPNVMKQKNAFPPNFIHSLDSSHMMLTSLHCQRRGVTFVSVHDCFWTHACTVEDLSKICRTQFVALHSQPILDDLSKFLKKRYCSEEKYSSADYTHFNREQLSKVLGQCPRKGDFDLNNVFRSLYFFS